MKAVRLERAQARMRRHQQPESPANQGTPSEALGSAPNALAEHFTPAEVSQKLKISTKQVVRFFEGRTGVLNLGGQRKPTRTDKRSKYSILRISHPALVQFLVEHKA
jgi:hypothetical protein